MGLSDLTPTYSGLIIPGISALSWWS